MKNRAAIIASLVHDSLTNKMKIGDIMGMNRIIKELPKKISAIRSVHIAKSNYIKEEFHVKSSATEQEKKVFNIMLP